MEQISEYILTESNMRDLVWMVNEEMDSVAAGEREQLEAAELELREVRQRMNRLWELVEKTEMTVEHYTVPTPEDSPIGERAWRRSPWDVAL